MVYLPERRGSLQVEMLAAARRSRVLPYRLDPRLDAILTEIDAGSPVVVLQNLALSWAPRWHYSVVIGYDLPAQILILRSGTTRRQVVSMRTFEHTWRRSNHWAIVAVAPGALPATAESGRYLEAAIAFEKVAEPLDAIAAFSAATQRWPDSALAWMGLGNNAFRARQWPLAEQAFGTAARLSPDPGAALNNLALTLAEQRRLDEAIEAARKAVGAGGTFEHVSRRTLEHLLERDISESQEQKSCE
jgi:tetratricopeptide (TPR) repeat protein